SYMYLFHTLRWRPGLEGTWSQNSSPSTWLDVGVAHLTTASCWVIYLQVLQEAVWPGGKLPAQPRPERSAAEREKSKEQCLDCLMQLLPEFITDILGSEKYRLSLETMLESLQDQQINKHLIFCICDLLLEFLIPESRDEAFQSSLLQSLTNDTSSPLISTG
uniref:Sorting nexin C-terminal domain-containing protein n=1 Tax=Mola mola TaxID=94237 RepID=A0A3Q3WU22_MOLML